MKCFVLNELKIYCLIKVTKSTFDYKAAKYDLIYIGIIVVKINWARNVDVV
jgi:hypothetical protein